LDVTEGQLVRLWEKLPAGAVASADAVETAIPAVTMRGWRGRSRDTDIRATQLGYSGRTRLAREARAVVDTYCSQPYGPVPPRLPTGWPWHDPGL
jgi:hypothetical protein